ncbi:MAG: hypothetical protein AABW41_04325 [Nanoarchaeota archaeon]
MKFSNTELKVISDLGNGIKDVSELAKSLKISISQVYRIAQKLSQKGILSLKDGILQPEMKTHINMLLKLLSKAANLSSPLSGTGLKIYMEITEPKTITDIKNITGLHKTTILKKINQGKKMSLVLTENRTYSINEKIWSDVKECIIELKKYENSIDLRVPVNSVIYYKTDKEIVFSNKEEIDAEKTAFSAYEKYGLGLLLITNYYYLPKKKLIIREVFRHSLFVAEKDPDIRYLIFITLFYLKHKKELSKIKHPIVDKLSRLLSGEKILGYPALAEIKDRAGVYKIKVYDDR